MLPASVINNQYELFIYFAGFDFTDIFLFAKQLSGIFFVLSDNKKCTPVRDSTGEFNCAEIAVGNPGIRNFYGQQHSFEQRAFLRMAVFTRKYVDWQTQHGIINDQRFAWQRSGWNGSQLFDAMLAFFDTVSIKQLYPQPWQRGAHGSAKFFNHRLYLLCSIAYQLGRCAGLDTIEFVVKRCDWNADILCWSLIGGMNRVLASADNLAHEVKDRWEHQIFGVLLFGGLIEPLVHLAWIQYPFHHAAGH